jgi:ubiquinone/menaquinone biosynthesis C-methylase UbiE
VLASSGTLPGIRTVFEFGASRVLGPLGYELRDRVLSERPEGFAGYLAAAGEASMDVNDYEEQRLGWLPSRPTLEAIAYPYLRSDSTVCEIGPGTGRWSRHLVNQLPQGELHLVDPSPWMVRFLAQYFSNAHNVHVHINDGYSLPFERAAWMDFVFSGNTFEELELGVIWLYVRDIVRVLKPGGFVVMDYIDPTTPEGWQHLISQRADLSSVYTFHAAEVIDNVFKTAGLTIERRYQSGKNTFVVARRA